MEKGKSLIPRGFSRYYILSLLSERPMTGKEIMDETEKRSGGAWRPSPGLVYPLLGKLLAKGLIEETEGGYRTTEKGKKELEKYLSSKEEFMRTFEGLFRLLTFGGFFARDIIDRIEIFFNIIGEEISKLGAEQRKRYKEFLRRELERLEKED